MLKPVAFLSAVAAASAFSVAPSGLSLRSHGSNARPVRTEIKMMDANSASQILFAAPGIAALAVMIDRKKESDAAPGSFAGIRVAPMPDIAVARANFRRWNDALQTKDALIVADMYVPDDLSFLPTVSPVHIKKGSKDSDTEEYFKSFVQKNPFGTITDDSIQVYSNGDAYLHSGLYTFELGDADKRTPVEARFSYVWRKVGGEWKISHHHSSVRPEAPKEAPAGKRAFIRSTWTKIRSTMTVSR